MNFAHRLSVHFPRAIVLGITGNWAFAAGTTLLALHRHTPKPDADIIVFCDSNLPANDQALLRACGAQLLPFTPPQADLTQEALEIFTPLSLAKFHCFDLVGLYDAVVWLDTDILIQDSITPLFACGPLALASEDPEFSEPPGVKPAAINLHSPIAGFDGAADNLNSGIIVFRRDLPCPQHLKQLCLDFMARCGKRLRYPDQAAFNYLAQHLRAQDQRVALLPQCYNTHPRSPQAVFATIVHAFGAYKLWNDGLTAACFPQWRRDYARWLQMGGSPYAGPVENEHCLQGGAFHLLRGLYDTLAKAEAAITALQNKLRAETAARARLEDLLRRPRP